MWLVETPTDNAAGTLQKVFPNRMSEGVSMCGYFQCESPALNDFWTLCGSLNQSEPWNTEQPWAVMGLSAELHEPVSGGIFYAKAWTVEHVLRNSGKVASIFVQEGWDAYFGFRPSESALRLLVTEFPNLAPALSGVDADSGIAD